MSSESGNNNSVWPEWLPLRDNLKNQSPYGAPQLPLEVKLNTNENPFSLSPALVAKLSESIANSAKDFNRYPDRDAIKLRTELAKYLNLTTDMNLGVDQIWAANGSNEIIQTLFLAFAGAGVDSLGFTPSYSMHENIARSTGTNWIIGERLSDFNIDISSALNQISKQKPKLVFITTPNNPTGTITEIVNIRRIIEATAQVGGLTIIDEAYAEFSEQPSNVELLNDYLNLVVIRTMSKAFSFAGVRVGYLAAAKEVVQALQLVRLPYHLSTPTQLLAKVALEFQGELLAAVEQLKIERNKVVGELQALGLTVVPSSANFLLFSVENEKKVWQELVKVGVLLRDVGIAGHLRATIGTPSENERFLAALREILRTSKGEK
ncbi:MAG: histidinol-phosphate transaminase [Candidatus Nanopelagicaceae bacterium]|nr:histidinol-phosphate transaminase [Candidatus Nanopelagicaceae bacterium]